ncbi:MAG TPA: helix-turn-helix transcriptional regulator [Tepidisphaeraceae bacterium]|jgi:ribosome-binding protein aMBF1 (putative translation factor)|nr:helix-turn-helix transcriptional regulator [Tepidisphaeraceae bacterium]
MVAQTIKIAGKRLVILEESEYLRLRGRDRKTLVESHELPSLPPRNRSGRRPAAAYILASIAREIVADRRAAGLSQQELADRAGIRQETLSRIESGKHTPKLGTLKKIDRVLGKSEEV